jgi:hypothetical protein
LDLILIKHFQYMAKMDMVLSLTLFDLICLKNSDEHFTPSMVG